MGNATVNDTAKAEDVPCKFIVGIDLGTTNSAVSYVDLTGNRSKDCNIKFLDIIQLIAPGELDKRSVLPSFLYLPGGYEIPAGSTALPWDAKREYAVGEIAREQGALVPGRLVSSAKSWLCHGGVDRTAGILPWGKDSDAQKVSPVEASSRYLQHIREVWNETIAKGRDNYFLEEQMIIITVPASFDEVARELTVKAAQKAGLNLNRIKLMEEPLAAFYAWLYQNKDKWQEKIKPGQIVLVCDVGGGTTDFTIIAASEGEDGLRFNRLSVGDHLMLGGDNMDLTIARVIEMQLTGQPGKLDSKKWHQLTHQCRKAKELLLSEKENKQDVDITIMGGGSKLIAGTLKSNINRTKIEELIIDGFFPFVDLEKEQKSISRKGLTEWGLPYVQNPQVTSHLADFWQRSLPLIKKETGRDTPYPDFLLFNGGALTPNVIRGRIQSVVQKWFKNAAGEDWQPEELNNPRPELAVAIGAVNYGIAKIFNDIKVGSGSPRAYYVKVAVANDNVDGSGQPLKTHKAVCLVPRNSEEGFETQLEKPSFEVITNQPVSFNIFSSSTRLDDKIGNIVNLSEEEVTQLPPIHTLLRYGKKLETIPLPVNLSVRLTETGTLELWCDSQQSSHRWQLQFDARLGEKEQVPSSGSDETIDLETIEKSIQKVLDIFNNSNSKSNPETLFKDIVSGFTMSKEKLPTSAIRKLADTLIKCKNGRSFSPQHEARWLNLLGFCMRPGFGDPLDEWRIKEAWKICLEGLKFPDKQQCISEWWILWRRIAGGLKAGQQMELYKQFAPALISSENKKKNARKNPKNKSNLHDELEIWMTLASLERLSAELKDKLGNQLLKKFHKGTPGSKELWSLSRLGARIPFHGPLDRVISAQAVTSWIKTILSRNLEPSDALAHALSELARTTGDRERDLTQSDKDILFDWLNRIPNGNYFKELINNPESALSQKEQDWIFGESLPPGLVISSL